jgi:hypothetical protein
LSERLNAPLRERLAALTRPCRHAAQRLWTLETGRSLIGSTYTFCWAHQQLSNRKQCGDPGPPAMAAGLTDHIWSVSEWLRFKLAPAPWVEPKRRGRPRNHPLPDPTVPKRSGGRPRQLA